MILKAHSRKKSRLAQAIKEVDLKQANIVELKKHYTGCIVLTQDHKILLQQRGADWISFPGYLSTFGGCVEADENPMQAIIRELKEELGAQVVQADILFLGAITEAVTKHTALVHGYFWHDKQGIITGCYEGEPSYFNDCNAALSAPNIMDDVVWFLEKCRQYNLID